MRFGYSIALILLCCSFTYSQNLTGIWRGYFIQKNYNSLTGKFSEENYRYEVQLLQTQSKESNSPIKGVTYSYKTIVFYGKASFSGMLAKKAQTLVLKEIDLIEYKGTNGTNPCLMTCYLDYSKKGNLQILSGNYTSVVMNSSSDCGEGTVYLEKVEESAFEKEDFLRKKKVPSKIQKDETNSSNKKNNISNEPSQKIKPTPNNSEKTISNKPSVKPGAEDFIITPRREVPLDNDSVPKKVRDSIRLANATNDNNPTDLPQKSDLFSDTTLVKVTGVQGNDHETKVPNALKERENKLINEIEVDEKQVTIDFYDNGQIDNDTITVYDNNKLIVNRGRLSYTPISVTLFFDTDHPTHELITVAENLGDLPPNTALMVVTCGKKRYEVFITSDEQKNAKVILSYKPKQEIKLK